MKRIMMMLLLALTAVNGMFAATTSTPAAPAATEKWSDKLVGYTGTPSTWAKSWKQTGSDAADYYWTGDATKDSKAMKARRIADSAAMAGMLGWTGHDLYTGKDKIMQGLNRFTGLSTNKHFQKLFNNKWFNRFVSLAELVGVDAALAYLGDRPSMLGSMGRGIGRGTSYVGGKVQDWRTARAQKPYREKFGSVLKNISNVALKHNDKNVARVDAPITGTPSYSGDLSVYGDEEGSYAGLKASAAKAAESYKAAHKTDDSE